jgi:DNA-binding transcriptional ArsR family regulator
MGQDELCVCDIMGVLSITQSKASRHLRYLFNAGLVTDRREGLWKYYRIPVASGSREGKQLQVLRELMSALPRGPDVEPAVAAMAQGEILPHPGRGTGGGGAAGLGVLSYFFCDYTFMKTDIHIYKLIILNSGKSQPA